MIFTFWEGDAMPSYLHLCMKTWKKFDHTIVRLNYDNVREWVRDDFSFCKKNIEKLSYFTLPQQADYVRAHVLRDNSGYWLDCDTIALTGWLPDCDIMGDPTLKSNTIGYLRSTRVETDEFYKEWCRYQEKMLDRSDLKWDWSVMGNRFTDDFLRKDTKDNVRIGEVRRRWPETYMIDDDIARRDKYGVFYFNEDYQILDLDPDSDILMLHNSWTPDWFKGLPAKEVLAQECTLSYILKGAI